MPDLQKPALTRQDWLWILAAWAIAVATLVYKVFFSNSNGPFFADTDDAMRMVVVRDLTAGQNWYDLVQHRLNTPYGAEIHWSRLVDLPIAALVMAASLFADPRMAAMIAGTIWPLLLVGTLLWLSARVAFELVGREGLLPALVLPILSPAVLAEFNPGRIDHHGVIIVLTMACLLASLVALRRPLAAWLAGVVAATALAVALEAAPLVVAAVLAFGLAYVADPARAANLRRFGLALAGGLAVHLALARPPSRWLEAACDMISPVFVLAGLGVGLAYLVVSVLPPPRQAWQRLALLGALGIAAVAVVVLAYPQCLAGPYGSLDPWLQENWIAVIVEAKPWHASLFELPVYAITVAAPVFLGLLATAAALVRDRERRMGWLTVLVFLACAALVMLTQIRGARLAILPAIPAAAWLIVRARAVYLDRPRIVSALGLVGSWLVFSGVILSMLVSLVVDLLPDGRAQAVAQTRASKQPCLVSDSFADLRALPPERIMTPIDLGSHMLLETPHEVVAAPYHRNEDGVLDAFRFFNRSADEAREIARVRGLGLLVTCPAMPEMRGAGLDVPGTLSNLLAAGTPPDWLEDVSTSGPLKVYAILP
ncbi:hypothetical protein SAMN06295905_2971 [Devosia lucknowensis]|uniref:4-amino-4-deoxy-L-arabinose transferase n=1 Tax=Devosia lucknowensis TaxID=1096929 RepID=A0A1Y6G690_9HYPH|nr:hypothetical protein [Devosia lucknowensis]SMQ85682.1 hypothetical protein SAMN06295905_2971 [Devosia lucknowensis]